MAVKIPDPLKRRHLIESGLDAGKALQVAEAYLAEDHRLDAVAFLARAGETDRLEAMLADVVREGDVFAMRTIAEALGRELERHHWEDAASAAREAGKERYAAEAQAQVERLSQ